MNDMDYIARARARRGGGGGEAVLVNKTVSANGTYLPAADSADGYKKVVVNVPTPTPTLINRTVSANGTYSAADDGADGYSSVTVNVPTPAPILTTKTVTENGTYSAEDDNADGYSSVTVNVAASGGAVLIASGTFTGGGSRFCQIPVGKKMPDKDFVFTLFAPNGTTVTGDSTGDRYIMAIRLLAQKEFFELDLSSDGTHSPVGKYTYYVDNAGTLKTYKMPAAVGVLFITRPTTSASEHYSLAVTRDSSGFTVGLNHTSAQYFFPSGVTYNWELLYIGSDPSNDIVEVA